MSCNRRELCPERGQWQGRKCLISPHSSLFQGLGLILNSEASSWTPRRRRLVRLSFFEYIRWLPARVGYVSDLNSGSRANLEKTENYVLREDSGSPGGIRTRDLSLERAAS